MLLLGAAVVFVLAFLVPNHYLPWMSFYSEFLAFLAFLICGLALAAGRLRVGVAGCFLLLLGCVPLLQWTTGKVFFSGDAWLAACYLWAAGLALTVGRGLAERYGTSFYSSLACLFLLVSVVSAGIAMAQWFDVYDGLWMLTSGAGQRATANLAQANHLATVLMLGIASVFLLRQRGAFGSGTTWLVACFLIVGLILTQSRTAVLGFFCVGVWWFWSAGRQSRIAPLAALSWFFLMLLGNYFVRDLAATLLLVEEGEARNFAEHSRLSIWGQGLSAALEGPFWGYGWNQVSVAQVSHALAYPVKLLTLHSHNVVLDMLLWNGLLPGLIIVLLAAAWLVRMGWRVQGENAAFSLACVGVIVLHGLLEYPLEYAYFLIPCFLLLGAVEAEQGSRLIFQLPRFSTLPVLGLSVAMMALVWSEYRLLEEDHRLLRFEMAKVGGAKASQDAPDVFLLTQLRDMARLARVEVAPGMPAAELEWMRKVAYRYPYVPSLYRYADALAVNGKTAQAVDVLLRMRSIYGTGFFDEVRGVLRVRQTGEPELAKLNSALEKY